MGQYCGDGTRGEFQAELAWLAGSNGPGVLACDAVRKFILMPFVPYNTVKQRESFTDFDTEFDWAFEKFRFSQCFQGQNKFFCYFRYGAANDRDL